MWENEGDVQVDWTGVVDYPDGTENPTCTDGVHRVTPAINTTAPPLAPQGHADMLAQAALGDRTAWRLKATGAWRTWYDALPSAQQDAIWSGQGRWATEIVDRFTLAGAV